MSDYEREYEWGGFDITKTAKGWVVEGWSRIEGCKTNWRHLVKPFAGIAHDADLEADWNDCYTIGEMLAERASEAPDKILAKGRLVE